LPNFSSSLAFIPAADVFAVKDGKETLLRDGTAHDHGDAIMAMHDKADTPSKC
jgi:hypothetical protein